MILGTLCYIRNAGRTLMLHRVKKKTDINKGKWIGLGGKIEPGESPEESVIREVEEESGLIIKKPQLRGVLTFPQFEGCDNWYVFVFTATEFEGELIDSNEGNLKWIDDDKLFSLELWEGDRLFMPWLEQDKFFSAKLVYEDWKLKEHSVVFHD